MLRVLVGLAVVLLACGAIAAEPTIDVSASPELPVSNLLANAGFEQGDEMPDHWNVSSALRHLFRYRRVPEGGRSGALLRIDATSTVMSGYCAQVVKVEPDTLYRAGAWTRLRGGHAQFHDEATLIDAGGRVDAFVGYDLIGFGGSGPGKGAAHIQTV